jgi:uncharacterized MAPEG superfamily protein
MLASALSPIAAAAMPIFFSSPATWSPVKMGGYWEAVGSCFQRPTGSSTLSWHSVVNIVLEMRQHDLPSACPSPPQCKRHPRQARIDRHGTAGRACASKGVTAVYTLAFAAASRVASVSTCVPSQQTRPWSAAATVVARTVTMYPLSTAPDSRHVRAVTSADAGSGAGAGSSAGAGEGVGTGTASERTTSWNPARTWPPVRCSSCLPACTRRQPGGTLTRILVWQPDVAH